MATDGSVLEVSLSAVVANWRKLCSLHPGAVAGVVKADAYGLGAVHVAPALHAAGCRHFFTAQFDEAMAIRALVPGAMVAALNGPPPDAEYEYLANDVTPVLGSLAAIDRWTTQARSLGRTLPVILHVDTGMHRLGLPPAEISVLADDPGRLDGLTLLYVMTHLVSAELPDDPQNAHQLARFAAACARLPPAPRSIANSSGIFLGPAFASDLARPGAALYGINPTPHAENPMRPVARLLAPVLQIRDVPADETVGYNATWRAARPSRIATAAIGYADGWLRAHSNRGHARFDGAPVPLVGRVSMDLCTYDVTDHPRIVPGDRLELLGPAFGPDAAAEVAGTNGYEILTFMGMRIARVYVA